MPGLEIQSTGEIIATYNGDVVEDAKWNMDYDGKNMDIETLHNNEMAFIQLDNNDLRRLFHGIGSQQERCLSERLKRDFVQGSVQGSSPDRRSSPKQGSAPVRRSSPKRSRPKTKRVRFMDDHLRKSGKQKQNIVIKKQGSAPMRRSSPKRSSPKRSSPKRSSSKRSSSKRSSPRSSSKKKTRKRELRKEDQDFIFDSRPDIEKTIY